MKLITFGCSFSSYAWPIWADIIAVDLEIEHENWALQGIGNQAISRRVMSKNIATGLNDDDLYIVQWTFSAREDRYIKDKWVANGSVFNDHGIYGTQFVKKYWDPKNDLINTLHSKMFVENILKDKKFFQFEVTDTAKDGLLPDILTDEFNEFENLMLEKSSHIPKFVQTPFIPIYEHDTHPGPLFWMNYVRDIIYPKFGYTLKQSTIDKVNEYQNMLTSVINNVYNDKKMKPIERSMIVNAEADKLSKKSWDLIRTPNLPLNKNIHF